MACGLHLDVNVCKLDSCFQTNVKFSDQKKKGLKESAGHLVWHLRKTA